MKHVAVRILCKDAGAKHVRATLDRCHTKIVKRAAGGPILRRKRYGKVIVEVVVVGGDPGKCPAHARPGSLDLSNRCARNGCERKVGVLKMLARRVDVIGGEGTARTDVVRTRRQHEMVDGKLAAAAEQLGKRAVAVRPVEHV